jgi:hypothetical protein
LVGRIRAAEQRGAEREAFTFPLLEIRKSLKIRRLRFLSFLPKSVKSLENRVILSYSVRILLSTILYMFL